MDKRVKSEISCCNFFQKNRKGSHVGVVVSFVVFVTFLVFLYLIIQPATIRERDKQYILDYLKLNLVSNSTIALIKSPLILRLNCRVIYLLLIVNFLAFMICISLIVSVSVKIYLYLISFYTILKKTNF